MSAILVTCAIILKNEKVLLVQRSEKMPQPLEWEFPGGKLEEGENETDCLVREIAEELQIKVKPVKRLTQVPYSYPTKKIILIPFICDWLSGEINLTEHKTFEWVQLQDLSKFNFCPADIPIVKELLWDDTKR